MTQLQRQTFASFGKVGKDAYTEQLEAAFDDGKSLAQEGHALSLKHVPQSMRTSFKAGYNSVR